jgi:DNA-binding NarL/FixJ family response regulator
VEKAGIEEATSEGEPGAGQQMPQLRLLVVARQPITRVGLRGLVAERAEIGVVGQAASAEEAAQLAPELRADVALAAWDVTDVDELAALAAALSAVGTPLVLLADAQGPDELSGVLRAGARGYLLADAAVDEVAAALHAVAQGLLVLDASLGRSLPVAQPTARPAALEESLTERERQVLELMALGLPNKAIARRLTISEHTVKFHVGSILGKLDAASRTDAVARAARRGLLAL